LLSRRQALQALFGHLYVLAVLGQVVLPLVAGRSLISPAA
jgi:hypothetical protein